MRIAEVTPMVMGTAWRNLTIVVGVALQKSYISVYFSISRGDLVQSYAGRLGECRMGRNNFSFVRFDDLNAAAVSALLAEADQIFHTDHQSE